MGTKSSKGTNVENHNNNSKTNRIESEKLPLGEEKREYTQIYFFLILLDQIENDEYDLISV